MTFKEKLQMEHPECVSERYNGGCECCPDDYGYEKKSVCTRSDNAVDCTKCWNREMPSTETKAEIDATDYINIYTEGHGKGYTEGLNDAWELARKIHAMEYGDFTKAFDVSGYDGREVKVGVINELTPQEALAKLKAYEEQSKIEVGDILLIYGEEAVVTRVVDEHANILFGDGVTNNMPVKELVGDKTGKHIDIKSFLEQIGE